MPLQSLAGLSSVLARGQSARWVRFHVERPLVLLHGSSRAGGHGVFPTGLVGVLGLTPALAAGP